MRLTGSNWKGQRIYEERIRRGKRNTLTVLETKDEKARNGKGYKRWESEDFRRKQKFHFIDQKIEAERGGGLGISWPALMANDGEDQISVFTFEQQLPRGKLMEEATDTVFHWVESKGQGGGMLMKNLKPKASAANDAER
ncbi:hypothetical protein K0M31_018349 [Melipona bicolor]|uniref:Uncharacterized protein n=1 Tax=Melipona bicolor TaxID=60889 RepID=A0AA40KRI1_9HYME|nr:hypothetical protein K0M31_018349 [Melipona bicolor]